MTDEHGDEAGRELAPDGERRDGWPDEEPPFWVIFAPVVPGRPNQSYGFFTDEQSARDHGRALGGGYVVAQFHFIQRQPQPAERDPLASAPAARAAR